MFEVFSCGDPSHFAVRFPVRVQALDDELRHLQAGERAHAAHKYREGKGLRCGHNETANPSCFATQVGWFWIEECYEASGVEEKRILGQPQEGGTELPWIDEQAGLRAEEADPGKGPHG